MYMSLYIRRSMCTYQGPLYYRPGTLSLTLKLAQVRADSLKRFITRDIKFITKTQLNSQPAREEESQLHELGQLGARFTAG